MMTVSGRPAGSLVDWAAEPKFDGWRAFVSTADGAVKVRTRRGHDVTPAVPELTSITPADVLLDGELIVGAGRLADFYRLAGRLAGPSRHGRCEPVTFAAFDVLAFEGRMLVDEPYEMRRRVLEGLQLGSP
jgi:bifunctional non-homologous end joining protein LigD